MKQVIIFIVLLTVLSFGICALSTAQEVVFNGEEAEAELVEVGIEVPAQKSADLYIPASHGQYAPGSTDERIRAIKIEKEKKIKGILEEIEQLEDRSNEAVLQKEIERIKMDAEKARFAVCLDKAVKAGDVDRAQQIKEEIDHLETLNKPTVGVPDQQRGHQVQVAE